MRAVGWITTAGGALAVAVLVWPASGTRWSMRVKTGPLRRMRLPGEPLAGAAAATLVVAAGLAPGHAAAAAISAVVCAATVNVLLASRRWGSTADGVARLAGVLANQASVAVTVTDAVGRAAPLVSGSIRKAAMAMAAECETIGVDVAAERFAARVPSSAARALADLVTISAEGGGRWAETVEVLEQEASQAAGHGSAVPRTGRRNHAHARSCHRARCRAGCRRGLERGRCGRVAGRTRRRHAASGRIHRGRRAQRPHPASRPCHRQIRGAAMTRPTTRSGRLR